MAFEALKDGTHVQLREPHVQDVERIRDFFLSLPAEDRRYLRFDLTREDAIRSLIRQAEEGPAYRVLALMDDKVVGHGVLDTLPDSWQRHIGEIRVVVAREQRGKWLGAHLIGHLVRKAEARGLQKAVVRLADPQIGGRKICDRLGFAVDGVLPGYFMDLDGQAHALVVMSCPLDQVSVSLHDFYAADDWPDG
ncbi:MAG: GNAT family N-acetyltransferase [Candidatus Eisenbacteria bacterium]|uniref:GNAT family N-acetyltransferase n=1 Tax=Eiseniibacteriota bacterium TaxID=2212470 RepID=A0A956LZU5_UNCEI|nr:GNAT family N-acetyltransferase [Candidatus Eisenbacteria bacterium]